MKRIWNTIIIMLFLLSVYAYAQRVGTYQVKNVEDMEGVIEAARMTVEAANTVIEMGLTKEEIDKEQWMEEYVTAISFGHGVTQEDITRISELKNLKCLEIAVSDREPDIDLSPLGSLVELQELSIYFYTQKEYIDFTFINELHNLRSVSIERCSEGLDLSLFKDLVYLQELYIEYVDDVDLSYLTKCRNLREVHIVGQHVRNLDGITGADHLRSLYLYDNTSGWSLDLQALKEMSDTGVEDVEADSGVIRFGYYTVRYNSNVLEEEPGEYNPGQMCGSFASWAGLRSGGIEVVY